MHIKLRRAAFSQPLQAARDSVRATSNRFSYQFCSIVINVALAFLPCYILSERVPGGGHFTYSTITLHFHTSNDRSSRPNYNVQSVDILSKSVIAHVLQFDSFQEDLSTGSALLSIPAPLRCGTHLAYTVISACTLATDLLLLEEGLVRGGVIITLHSLSVSDNSHSQFCSVFKQPCSRVKVSSCSQAPS